MSITNLQPTSTKKQASTSTAIVAPVKSNANPRPHTVVSATTVSLDLTITAPYSTTALENET